MQYCHRRLRTFRQILKNDQISKRVQSYLQSPRSDKELTLAFKNENTVGEIGHSFFITVLLDLMKGRSAPFLLSLNFREIENFLRDSNATPAFTGSTEELLLLEKLFIEVKWQFLANIFLQTVHVDQPGSTWESLTLARKNAYSAEWVKEIEKFLGDDWAVKFVFIDGETLTLKTLNGKWSDEALQNFFGRIWNVFSKQESIKVVAVS